MPSLFSSSVDVREAAEDIDEQTLWMYSNEWVNKLSQSRIGSNVHCPHNCASAAGLFSMEQIR